MSKSLVKMLINCFIWIHCVMISHSLCCLLPAPPIPLSSVCISLYITVCRSNSPDYSTPFPPPSFSICNPVPCPLCVLCHHSSLQYVFNLFKSSQRQFMLDKLCFERDVWQRREGNREWEGKWVRVAMRKVFHSIRRGYTSYAVAAVQNELNKKSPTHLLWLCTQVQSV